MSLLHRVRQKTDTTKKRIAGTIAVGVTGMIAVVWLSTLPARFGDIAGGAHTSETSSLSGFVTEVKSQVGAVSESLPKTTTTESETYHPPESSAVRIKAVPEESRNTPDIPTTRAVRIATTSRATLNEE